MSKRAPPLERIAAMTTVEPNTGCHLWLGQVDKDGYACVWDGERKARAARLVYQLVIGPTDDELVVDHRCNVRCCVNPAHLQLVTQQRNVERQERVTSGICKRGHSLADSYLHYGGRYWRRHCRQCRAEASLRYSCAKEGARRG